MELDLSFMFQSLFFQSLKASVLIVLIFGLRFALARRLSPMVKHAIWLLVPLALLVSIPSSWSLFNYLPEFSWNTIYDWNAGVSPALKYEKNAVQTVPIHPLAGETPTLPGFEIPVENTFHHHHDISLKERTSTPSGFSYFKIAVIIWLMGCFRMASLFLRQGILCRRWLEKAVPIKDGRVLSIFEQCVEQSGLRCWILALKSDDVPTPLLIGAIRPRLLIPCRFVESASNEDLQNVFLHELAHLKRYDVWTSWLMSFLLILHWFNPLLWLAIKSMNDDREQACDVMALKKLDRSRRKHYSLLLVSLAEQGKTLRRIPGLVGLSETGRQLTGRLETIKRIGSWKPAWTVLACIPVLLFALTLITDAQNRHGYFSSLFSAGLERFNEFDAKRGTTDGYIRELLGDAEKLNHELRIIVLKIRGGDSSSDWLERANEINVSLRIIMDEIRLPELRIKRKNTALHRSAVLISLQEQVVAEMSQNGDLNQAAQQLIDETQRLKNRLDRVSRDLQQAEKLNGYTFELIEESEGIHYRLGVLLDEIRGSSSHLDRHRILLAEAKRELTEYRLWEEMLTDGFSSNIQMTRNDLLSLVEKLEHINFNEATSSRLLQETQVSVTVSRNAIEEKRESINFQEMILSLSEKTANELQDIFALHP